DRGRADRGSAGAGHDPTGTPWARGSRARADALDAGPVRVGALALCSDAETRPRGGAREEPAEAAGPRDLALDAVAVRATSAEPDHADAGGRARVAFDAALVADALDAHVDRVGAEVGDGLAVDAAQERARHAGVRRARVHAE